MIEYELIRSTSSSCGIIKLYRDDAKEYAISSNGRVQYLAENISYAQAIDAYNDLLESIVDEELYL